MAQPVIHEQHLSTAGTETVYDRNLPTDLDESVHHQLRERLAGCRVPSQSGEANPGAIDTTSSDGPDWTHMDTMPCISTPAGSAVQSINYTSGVQTEPDPVDDDGRMTVDCCRVAPHVKPLWAKIPTLTPQPQLHNASCSASKGPVPADTPVTKMPPSKHSFLGFPAEIRNQIYDYACHWPDSRSLYSQYSRQIDEYYAARRAGNTAAHFPAWQGCPKAFTILLLCKQITRECRPILESRFLVIDRLPPWPKGDLQPLPLAKFITRETLQSVKRLEIRITLGQGKEGSGWYWDKIIDEIVGILLDKNSFRELHIVLSMACMHDPEIWMEESCYLKRLRAKVWQLRSKNPNWCAPGAISSETWIVTGLEAHRVRLIFFDSIEPQRLPATPSGYRDLILETVRYPNQKVWPGSILEFL